MMTTIKTFAEYGRVNDTVYNGNNFYRLVNEGVFFLILKNRSDFDVFFMFVFIYYLKLETFWKGHINIYIV